MVTQTAVNHCLNEMNNTKGNGVLQININMTLKITYIITSG